MSDKTTDRIPGWQGGSKDGSVGLGADLRARREELGWQLSDVANWLRIRETYLRALEEGNAGVFPGSAYALGFLRTYAHALGMDPDQAVARYRHDTRGAADHKPELTFPEPVSERGVPVGLWVGAGLAVLVGTYIAYYHFSGSDPVPTRQMPPVAEIMPGVTQHGTTSPQIAAVMPERGLAPSPETAPKQDDINQSPSVATTPAVSQTQGAATRSSDLVSQPSAPVAGEVPGNNLTTDHSASQPAGGSLPENASGVMAASPVPLPGSNMPSATTAPQVPNVSQAGVIVLHAGTDAWVQIKDKTGATVFSRVLKSGENWQGSDDAAPYRMTLGNAGGLTLSAGDVTTAPLGHVGAVRRNLTVTSQAIRDGQLGQESGASVGATALPGDGSVASPVPSLKKAVHLPKIEASQNESETDRLNARQLEQTAQPR